MDMATEAARLSDDVSLGRVLEVFASIVLALATVGSAWAVYQANQWNNKESDEMNASNTARIESSKQTTIATASVVYDATVLSQSAAAVADGNTQLQQFYRDKLYRPEFRAFVDQAIAAAGGDPTAIPNLFANQTYLNSLFDKPRQLEDQAEKSAVASNAAGTNANSYVLIAVILAITLFFAGTATSISWVPLRAVLLAVATVALAVGAARLASLPLA
jgi:hypothetical protein